MNFLTGVQELSAKSQDCIAGTDTPQGFDHAEYKKLVASAFGTSKASKYEVGQLMHLLCVASMPKDEEGNVSGISELCGLEDKFDPREIIANIKANAVDPRLNKLSYVTCDGAKLNGLPLLNAIKGKAPKGSILIAVHYLPKSVDTVQSFRNEALDGAIKGLAEADRFKMFRAILAQSGDDIAGLDDAQDVNDLVEGIRRQARQERRETRTDGRQDRLELKQLTKLQKRENAREAHATGNVPYDDGIYFTDQENRLWAREPQRKLLPVVNSSSTAGGQNSLANGVSGTYTGSPTMEVEINKVSIRLEGGATNVEIQETMKASIAVTSVKVGSIELMIGAGGAEFPDGDKVEPSFWSCIVVTGGNSNFVLTAINAGATMLFNITAYCRKVVPA